VRVTFVRLLSFARWRHFISKVTLNKLCRNVHSKVTLMSAKFGADLITISKDTDHKTKWPVGPVFWPTGRCDKRQKNYNKR